MTISGASPHLHDWEESLWQQKQDKFLKARSALNSTVQKQLLLVAQASTFLQAVPRAVDLMDCKGAFVEVFAMAEP